MKIATYNVNGVNGRLPVLLRWLGESRPDVVCLQELKAPEEKFPEQAILDAGYHAIWHGQKSWNGVAILSKIGKPGEVCRALPGDPEDIHSRYIEANIKDIRIGCLYLPNGNPAPGPKFDYKLRWFERLSEHASKLPGFNKASRPETQSINPKIAKSKNLPDFYPHRRMVTCFFPSADLAVNASRF